MVRRNMDTKQRNKKQSNDCRMNAVVTSILCWNWRPWIRYW